MSQGLNYSQEQFETLLRELNLEMSGDGRVVKKGRLALSEVARNFQNSINASNARLDAYSKQTNDKINAGIKSGKSVLQVLSAMQKAGRRTIVEDGFKFPSQKEATRYRELCRLRDLGMVRNIEPHPWWDIVVNNVYIRRVFADFKYEEIAADGRQYNPEYNVWRTIVEDVKAERRDKIKGGIKFSTDTSLSKHGRRLVLACFGIEIKVIK